MIIMHTSFGDITLELDEKKAPKTVANFLAYASEGFFNDTIFHRVIDNFMIQGGGMDENMQQKPTKEPVENEADNGLKNVTGTIAMARTMDPHSATAQFFINVKDNDFLNFKAKNSQGWGYTVFGKVTDGMTVVNKIKSVATATRSGQQDVPVEAVRKFETELLSFMDRRYPELLKTVREKKIIDDTLKPQLESAIKEFKGTFKV